MSRSRNSRATRDYAAERRARAVAKSARAHAEARRRAAHEAALHRDARAPARRADDASEIVFAEAPRLRDGDYGAAVTRILAVAHVRPLGAWAPRGKGRASLFRSLADHLLARFPTPSVFWSVFFDAALARLVPLVVHVAAGASFANEARDPSFPIPMTRKVCHAVTNDRANGSLLQAIRRAQVDVAGGDARLLASWIRTAPAQTVGTRDEETFWGVVLTWLARSAPVPSDLGPLVDYIAHRRREDESFAIAGRSVRALLRGMAEWHRELAYTKGVAGTVFSPSGFRASTFDLSTTSAGGAVARRIWRVEEILTARALADEGRRMGHCVYSYAGLIERRAASIWSMTFEDGEGPTGRWSMLTIEVRNELRRIVQARGRFNRPATSAEHTILLRWAGANGLALCV